MSSSRVTLAIALILMTGLSACKTGRVSFRGKPDAYAVVPRTGLAMPPAGGGLPQPQPSNAVNKDAHITQDMARKALLGDTTQVASVPALQSQFGQYQDSNIRQVINAEAEQKSNGPRNAIDNFLQPIRFVQNSTPKGTPVDLQEELRILRAKGVATTTLSYSTDGHSLILLQTGSERPFDPNSLLNSRPK